MREASVKYRRPLGLGIPGIGCVLLAIWLPVSWFQAAAVSNPQDSLLSGEFLFRLALVFSGSMLIFLAFPKSIPGRIAQPDRAPLFYPYTTEDVTSRRLWIIGAITLVALALRLYRLDADLWIDEIITAGHLTRSLWELLTVYRGSNDHLLNTLLAKVSVAWFGDKEWTIRLPAALFGAASIPACYWLARMAMPVRASLAAAFLAGVSYHHIFYSQDARGYSFYFFFSLVSTGLLIRGLETDRTSTWLLYIATTLLNFASLLISSYVFAAQIFLAVGALVWMKRQGRRVQPMLHRLVIVLGASAVLAFQLYAAVVPQSLAVMQRDWTKREAGYSLFSLSLSSEIMRSLSAGLGPLFVIAAIPALLIGAAGLVYLFHRNWLLTLALTLPCVLQLLFLLVNGLSLAPRIFILLLAPALLAIICGLEAAGRMTGRILGTDKQSIARYFLYSGTVLVGAASLVSLKTYYAAPKQDYRGAIRYLKVEAGSRRPVTVVGLAKYGFRYYGSRNGFTEREDYRVAESVEEVDELCSTRPGNPCLLVTTLFYLLEIDSPDLAERILSGWQPQREFPGAIGGGEVCIWVSRRFGKMR
jgi:mannosyltransferase